MKTKQQISDLIQAFKEKVVELQIDNEVYHSLKNMEQKANNIKTKDEKNPAK